METIPLLCWMLLVPDRSFGALWHRVLFLGGCFVFWFIHRVFVNWRAPLGDQPLDWALKRAATIAVLILMLHSG